jgi:hypothetical protein
MPLNFHDKARSTENMTLKQCKGRRRTGVVAMREYERRPPLARVPGRACTRVAEGHDVAEYG